MGFLFFPMHEEYGAPLGEGGEEVRFVFACPAGFSFFGDFPHPPSRSATGHQTCYHLGVIKITISAPLFRFWQMFREKPRHQSMKGFFPKPFGRKRNISTFCKLHQRMHNATILLLKTYQRWCLCYHLPCLLKVFMSKLSCMCWRILRKCMKRSFPSFSDLSIFNSFKIQG